MLVTQAGIVTLVSPLQSRNAFAPMLVTGYPPREGGIVTAPPMEGKTAKGGVELPPSDALPFDTLYIHLTPFTVSAATSVAAIEYSALAHATNAHRMTLVIRFISLLLSLTRF